VPEHLYIPFAAVTGFFDPSVEFGLRFETADEVEAEEEEENAPAAGPSLVVADGTTKIIPEKPRKSTPAPEVETRSEEDAEAAPGDAKVISIDAFRKKT
jgi:hypothetical protein